MMIKMNVGVFICCLDYIEIFFDFFFSVFFNLVGRYT